MTTTLVITLIFLAALVVVARVTRPKCCQCGEAEGHRGFCGVMPDRAPVPPSTPPMWATRRP